ncbi:MAG: ABC transporter permease [Desulfatirhabdiaceae bacterium]
MIGRLKPMLIKEFLQMLRDPRMRVVVFGFPVIQMMIMAFALTTDVTDIRTAILDMDRSAASRELTSRFTAGGYFSLTRVLTSHSDVAPLLDGGEVSVVISIPPGFEQDIHSGKQAGVQILTDGTDSNTSAIIMGYVNGITGPYNQALLAQRLSAGGIQAAPVELVSRAWFNPNQESKHYFVPALIAVMLLIFSILLTSIGIVREKEIGTIEQVMVTPIRRMEYILGKTIPYIITGYITMTMMLGIAMLIFDIRIQGSLLLLYALTGIYLCGNLGLALLISASAQTQQQALLTAFLILMPCVLLSGFMFPIKNMPESVQYATYVNPMRWYLEILRGVVMKGVGLNALWHAVLAQLILAVSFIALAASRVKKTLA